MEYSYLLLVFLVTSSVQCIHVEEGCEVKSEWTIKYEWPDMYLSAWVAPDTQDIFTIKVEFEGKFPLETSDNIVISRSEFQVDHIREGKSTLVTNHTDFNIGNGWVDLVLTLNSHYSLMYNGKGITTETVDYTPISLTFRGSNITVNCLSGLRVWKIDNRPSTVPLDDSQKHLLSFYSSKEFSPGLELNLRDIALGRDNGALTTIPSKAQPLPPFKIHNLSISCSQKEESICSINIGKEMKSAEEMRVGNLPKAVTIRGRTNDPFYLILNKGHSLIGQENEQKELDLAKSMSPGVLALIVIVALLAIALVFVLLVRRQRMDILRCKSSAKSRTPRRKDDAEAAIDTVTKDEKERLRPMSTFSKDSGVEEICGENNPQDNQI